MLCCPPLASKGEGRAPVNDRRTMTKGGSSDGAISLRVDLVRADVRRPLADEVGAPYCLWGEDVTPRAHVPSCRS